MIVMKFGGSSVKNGERIRYVSEIVKENLPGQPVLVFSALGDTTDNLLEAGANALEGNISLDKIVQTHSDTCKELEVDYSLAEPLIQELEDLLRGISLLRELSPKTKDYLLSFGERLSVRIISEFFNRIGIKSKYFDAWDIGFRTDSNFNEAELNRSTYESISSHLGSLSTEYKFTPIVTGFLAKDGSGNITTLGRGGSDLSASILGAALKVKEIQVWKDVDGILTTDPRIVPEAQSVPEISFEEASELAYYGAKVLHPLSVQPAMAVGIPVRVKNSYNPPHPGSRIIASSTPPEQLIRALTCKRDITLVDIISSRALGQHGFLAKVFDIFQSHEISVDMVATSEVSVSVTLDNIENLDKAVEALQDFSRVSVTKDKSIISLIGDMGRSSEILDAAFAIFKEGKITVQMISQGASKVNVGMIVEDHEAEFCIQELHRYFFDKHNLKSAA